MEVNWYMEVCGNNRRLSLFSWHVNIYFYLAIVSIEFNFSTYMSN